MVKHTGQQEPVNLKQPGRTHQHTQEYTQANRSLCTPKVHTYSPGSQCSADHTATMGHYEPGGDQCKGGVHRQPPMPPPTHIPSRHGTGDRLPWGPVDARQARGWGCTGAKTPHLACFSQWGREWGIRRQLMRPDDPCLSSAPVPALPCPQHLTMPPMPSIDTNGTTLEAWEGRVELRKVGL